MRRLAAAALVVAGLAGCGGQTIVVRTVTVTTSLAESDTAGPVDPADEDCLVYARGTSEVVEASGPGAGAVCNVIVRTWSKSGTFWSVNGDGLEGRELICAMRKGSNDLDVFDDPTDTALTSRPTCAALAARGFVEVGAGG